MDPYLEAPDIWPDLHDALAGEIRGALNGSLPAPYYARLEMRPEIGIVEDESALRRIIPDVAVVRRPARLAESAVALVEAPRTRISKSLEVEVASEPIRHAFVEVRDPSRGHRLVTLIEIVSPANKAPGPDRRAYLRKQREVLESDASLVELDLLRHGERLLMQRELERFVQQLRPEPDYLVLVNRAWRRAAGSTAYQVFPVTLAEPLPCIPIPLREDRDDVPLDLQFVFSNAYDRGPYRRGAVDYSQPPDVPLPSELADWADQCLQAAGLR
jgi:hypothetical protein